MKAAARVIYRGSWETERPAIMRKYGWDKSNSEVLIRCAQTLLCSAHIMRHSREHLFCHSTPRRFGKTFRRALPPFRAPLTRAQRPCARRSIAIFCACLSLAFGLEVRVFG
jgi:hypothetical protein